MSTTAAPKTQKHKMSRRRFIGDAARATCGAALGGLALAAYAKQTRASATQALRPPGALEEEQFLGACVRCGLCVRDCPYDTLKLSDFSDDVPLGTPFFTARDVPCEMCDDIPCVQACPTGALDKSLDNIDNAKMGVAVLTSTDTCLNYLGLRCDVCYRVCPLIGEAITLDRQENKRTGAHARFIPTVIADKCTGCGKCERSCVLEEAAIKVLPIDVAAGHLDKHYRLGWVEQEKAGKPLIDNIIDLPDRAPSNSNTGASQ